MFQAGRGAAEYLDHAHPSPKSAPVILNIHLLADSEAPANVLPQLDILCALLERRVSFEADVLRSTEHKV
jgi:hypothetical protein